MHLFALLMIASAFGPGVVETPQPSGPLAWPSGLLEVRIALREPISESILNDLVGREIPFDSGSIGEPDTKPTGVIRVAGVRAEDGGRTIVLLTDPHPTEATYRIDSDGPIGALEYGLTGVEVSWTAEGEREPEWTGWLPELDLAASREAVTGSVEHDRLFATLERPGMLELRTLIALPEGGSVVAIRADRAFEAEMMFVPIEVGPSHRAEHAIDSFGEPAELFVRMPTGLDPGNPSPSLTVGLGGDGEDAVEPLAREAQILPWAPAPITHGAEASPLPEALKGGDPARGEAVYFGEKANCATCHRVGDRGGEVGPDLSGIGSDRTLAEIYRDIESPSSEIAPRYLPYTVAMDDGRVFVGLVRAAGPDRLEVVGADAEAVQVPREEVEEIGPVSTSIMPVGLAGAIGQDDLRDLLAYLEGRRGD